MRPSKVMNALLAREGFVPVAKAARVVGVHATTIYHLIDGGEVQGKKVGVFRYVHAQKLADHFGGGVFAKELGALCHAETVAALGRRGAQRSAQ